MVTFNSTKKKNTGGGNPSYVGNNQSGYSTESGSDEKNKGGILGGLGYVGAGLAAGIGSVGEGIIDLLLAGGGLLTGNVDYAKHVFKDNTVGNWFADVTEDFNPGTGWEFAGNVTHGLGQSSVFLLNLIPGLGQLGTAAFFAGVGSQGISSAAATTGDVGFKEVAYGVASGAVEGALEKAFGGMGKAVKTLGGSTMKNITKTAVRKGLVKQVLSDAASEFGEEFASEYIDTFLQRGFQIDPNKTTSLRDALYAGAVGFTSGAVSAGSANVLKAIGNERVGDRIVKSGNSQTLVNTATKVADKLAAQGTNWDRAGEWVKALRGQVDAYNKLSENEKTSMRGKTILGEMKSSLFFAETQSTFDLVKKSIQNSDEQTRATFAEYINRSVEKSKRNGKDYTAADIAKDTDGVAWQLAIYKFVPSLFDLDGALADMQQESGIADVIARNQGAESGTVVGADPVAVGAEQYDLVGKDVNGNEIYETSEETKKLPRKQRMRKFVDIMNNEYYGRTAKFTVDGETYYARFDQKDVNKNVYGDHRSDRKGYNAKIDVGADGNIFELVENAKYQDSRAESGKSTDAHKNVSEWDYFDKTVVIDGTQYDVLINIRKKDNGEYVYSVQLRESKKEASSSSRAHYDNSHSSNKEDDTSSGGRTPPASANTLAGTSKTSGRSSTDNSIHPNEPVVNPEAKENSSNDAINEKGKNLRSDAVKVKGKQTGAETVQDETAGAIPRTTGEFNGEVDLERAKRDAERIIEWERKKAPTVDELNRVRGAVKNFDSLSGDRQRAIVRMVRSGKNIDEGVIRGVSNIMAITNKKGAVLAPDVEIRFAEFGKDSTRRGIKTEVGGKTVIVLNANAKSTDILRGTIAHEIVHYLENRKGYKALAEYAMKHAKSEKVAQVRETYKKQYTIDERKANPNATEEEIAAKVDEKMRDEAAVNSEIVGNVVAELLGSEKFIKRYAQMGEEQSSVVKKIARFVKGIANALKEKDKEAGAVAAKMMNLVDKALGSEVSGEKTGEKASFNISPDEDREWEKPITMDDVETLRSIGRKSINSFSAEDIKKAQKWAYKFYKELGVKSPFFRVWFGEWRAHDKSNVKVVDTKADNRKEVINADTGWKVQTSKKVHKETMHHLGSAEANAVKYLPYIDDITKKAILFQTEISNKDNPNSLMFHTMYAYTEVMGYPALLKLKVEELFYYNNKESGEITRDYILQNIEEESLSKSNRLSRPNHLDQNSSILSISDLYDLVNTFDKEFSPAPEVNEYMLNEDGTPKVFYHGTNADFTVFDLKKSGANFGVVSEGMFFFTDKKKAYPSSAEDYAKYVTNAKGGKEKIYDCYLKMHKPLVLDSSRSYDPISYYDRNAEKIYEKYFEGDYDGIIVTDFSKKNSTSTLALVDNSAQIKSATNNIGTFDKSEPDIRYDLDPEAVERETEKQKKKTTTKAEPKGIKTGSAEAGRFAVGLRKEFGLNKAAEETIRLKLESLEEVFIKGDREAYVEEYKKRVEEIFDIVRREGVVEVATDNSYRGFQTYMRGKKFRVDKRFRQNMGKEEWKGVYSVIRGRLASDKNTTAPHVDSLYAELNELFPDLFPSEIINVHDQLERIAKVMLDAKNAQSEEFGYSQLPEEWQSSIVAEVIDRINSFITRVSSNRDSLKIIKAERNELIKMLKKERSLREKMAREDANAAKAERAKRYTKTEVAPAVEEIEALTDEQVKSLAKGFALEGMSGAQKDRIISDIYIALHEASAEGEAGPGSLAVKTIATRIAWDMVQSARIKGKDGKLYHLVDIYNEASVQAIASEYANVLYERFANMGEHTKYSYFVADIRAAEEEFRRDKIDDNAIHKLSREVSYQGQQLRRLAEIQKRGVEDDGIQKVTKILASVVDAKGNIVTSKVDEAIGEADRFYSLQSGMADSQGQAQEGTALTEFAYSSDANLKFMIDEFKRLRARVDKRGKDRVGKFLDAQEMRLLGKILAGMRKTVTEYNKVFINEHYVNIDRVAGECATDIVEYHSLDKKAKTKVGEMLNNLMRGVKQSYFYNVLTPETTIEALEGFKIGGVLKTLYHDVRIHKQKAEHLAVQMKKPFAEFLDAKGEIDIPVGRDVAGTDSVSDSDFDERSRIQNNVATFNSAEENTDVLNMISSVEAKKHNDNDKVYFENVSDDIAQIIHQLTGVDVKGFKVAIEARQLEHILNRHGKNGKQDQSLSDNSDIAKIESVLKHPDKIRRAGKTKAYSYTQDNKNKTADTVLYEMLLKDKSYYVVQAVPDTKSKTLYIVTAFMGEQGYESKITKGTPQLIDANAPTRTSENDFVVVPKNIIHQSKENVNKKISTIKVNPTWKDENGKKHSFRDKLNKKMINYNGAELTLGEAIYLYMLTKRELTHAGLKENGYIVYDENNQRRLKLKIEDVENVRNEIGNQLDDADKAFLKMAEEFFNKTSTEVKNEADMRIFGYTNIEDGYYVPMIRDRYSRMQGVTDQRQSVGSIITVFNKSFNQNTVQNAKALEGKSIMSIINDHADGLADYSELYIPLKSFDRVYNQAVSVNGETRSIREILNDEVWNKTGSYLRDLFADIQGQNRKSDNVIDSMVGKLRSAWVNSVLGLNLKVVATQTTSFVAANQVIEAKYLMPAMKKFFGNQSELGTRADQYSDIIEARSFEMGALRAQGNIDKVMEWSSKTGFMINLMDRRVCLAVFHAAELKAEAQGAGAVGTVENAKAAAKIADQAIYTTQAMTSASERSALQRSKSEIARTLSMFTSDSVKNLSHFVGNIMKYQAHKARAKSNLASAAQYESELKKDAKAIRRSAKTLVMTGVMLGLITQAFKYLYAKEEEEPEEKAKDLATDVISSTFNILPGVSDIIDKFVFDYDLSLNVFDVANDTIEDTASLMNTAGQAMAGEYVSGDKVFKDVLNFVKTVGAAFGAPIAPVERTITGLLRRFFPSAIYGYDAMMSNPSYSADLQAAVENGDEALAEHILETIYKNEATGVYSTPELEEVARLYGLGNTSVIPQKIGATINDVKLDRKQRAQFEKIYGEASAKVNELIRSEYYADLDDEQRAKAIKTLYSLYYNRAAAEVAGVEWSNAQAYSRLTDNYAALFAAQAYKSGLTPYKTLRGKEVSVKDQFVKYVENLGLNEADKLVVLYANGYRDTATKKKMLAYINSLSISEEEKTKIAERLGFALENGKVVEKKEELEVRAE